MHQPSVVDVGICLERALELMMESLDKAMGTGVISYFCACIKKQVEIFIECTSFLYFKRRVRLLGRIYFQKESVLLVGRLHLGA